MRAALQNWTDLKSWVSANQQNKAIGTTVIYHVWKQSRMLNVKFEEKLQNDWFSITLSSWFSILIGNSIRKKILLAIRTNHPLCPE